MTISTTYNPIAYQGDGIATSFPISFPFQLPDDIVVYTEVVATGIATQLVYGTDYTISPAVQIYAGTGTLTLNVAPIAGVDVVITRSPSLTQNTHWLPNNINPANSTENAVDKLTMILQGISYLFGRSWYLPLTGIDGSSYFDARGNRGGNLGAPIQPNDAVTLAYMQNAITQLINTGSSTTPSDYEYVGNGSTVTFSIPGATVAQATGYFVTIDGIVQRPTADYSITLGPTPSITFTGAPPNLTLIGIRVLGYAQAITSGISGSAINSGVVAPQYLGGGTPYVGTFLRGDGNWSNVLIGNFGPAQAASSGALVADFQNAASASIRVSSAGTAAYTFGTTGGAAQAAAWTYNPSTASVAFDGNNPSMSQFYTSGNVFLGNSLFINFAAQRVGINTLTPVAALDVNGTVNATLFTGNAAGSLITSGQVLPQFLASNAPGSGLFLRGDGLWAVPSGGGGGSGTNTTTTASFTVAAVNSSQVIPVTSTSVTPITPGAYLYVNDGAGHNIVVQVTSIAALNVTATTVSITQGAAGNTMASGATVGLASVPGTNTILVSDAAVSNTSITAQSFSGSTASVPAGGYQVDLYLASTASGTAQIKGYLRNNFPITQIAPTGLSVDAIGLSRQASNNWGTLSAGANGSVLQSNGTSLSFALIGASNITTGSLTPALLSSTNAVTSGYVPSYNGAGQFTWVPQTGVPTGGTTGQFVRADGTLTNILKATVAQPDFQLQDTTSTYTAHFKQFTGTQFVMSMDTPRGPSDSASAWFVGGILISGITSFYQPIDPGPTYNNQLIETFYSANYSRGPHWRADSAFWTRMQDISNPTASYTVDLSGASYYRFSGITQNITLVVTDTSALPNNASFRYATELHIEIVAPGSFTFTFPANVTWANGAAAPTLSATGVTVIRLLRRQGQTQWIGYLDGVSGGTYTDAQAINAIMSASRLLNSSSVQWALTTGTSGNATPSLVNGGVTGTHLANGTIGLAKLSATGTPSSTTYLRGDNTWASIASGGQTAIQFALNGTNFGSAGTVSSINFVGFTTSGTAPFLTITAPSGGGGSVPSWQLAGSPISGGPFTTINLSSGFSASTSGTTLNITGAGGGGGSFSPATTYTWTAAQAFNAGTTWATNSSSTYGPSQFYGGNGTGVDGSLGSVSSLWVHTDNKASFSNSVNVQTASFWHNLYTPGTGLQATEFVLNVLGNINNPTTGFLIGTTFIAACRQMNYPAGGTMDTTGWTCASPDIHYAAGSGNLDPTTGQSHSWTGGLIRLGETNYGNAWADFGMIERRIDLVRGVAGLEFFPDYLGGPLNLPIPPNKYPAQWAICIGYAGVDARGLAPQNYIGVLIDENGICPGGYALRLSGAVGTFNGQSATANAPAAIIKMSGSAQTGIDFAGTAHSATPLTATNTGAPVITMSDTTQSIKLGSVWIRGNGGHLQYSTNGTTWTNIV